MSSFRGDISDQLAKSYFSSIPLLPLLMEKNIICSSPVDGKNIFCSLPVDGKKIYSVLLLLYPTASVSGISQWKNKARTKRRAANAPLHAGFSLFFRHVRAQPREDTRGEPSFLPVMPTPIIATLRHPGRTPYRFLLCSHRLSAPLRGENSQSKK